MAKTYMNYKVKFEGNTIAQFENSTLAVHFIKSFPQTIDFILNFNNTKTVWDTAKEGIPSVLKIDERVEKFCAEQDARFEAKMARFQSARKVGA